jgi:putative membrane protein
MKLTGLLSLACVAMLTVACNGNGRTDVRDDSVVGTTGADVDRSASAGDREFVEDLTYAGAAEIELGRMAAERGGDAEVKRFGQMMVDDHSKAGKELTDIATQFKIPQPAGLDEKHRELMDKLAKLRGVEFDKQYIDAMVEGHEDVVDKLESRVDERDRSAVITGQAPKDTNVKPEAADNHIEGSLNTWAAGALPVVKAHLDRAKAIQDALKDRGRNTTARN